jgi:hypothetical protein
LTELEAVFNEIGGDALVSALSRCIRELKFMPTIAEIRDSAGLNQKKQEAANADNAWSVVLLYIERWHGVERIYRGQDPTTGETRWEYPPKLPPHIEHAVRAAGGVRCIANTSPEDLPFRIKNFREAIENSRHCPEYRQLSAGSQEPEAVLRGVFKSSDHSLGIAAGSNHCPEETTDDDVIADLKSRMAAKHFPEQERPGPVARKPHITYSAPLSDQEFEEKKRQAFAVAEAFERKQAASLSAKTTEALSWKSQRTKTAG